jgi:drug/metabolite transporter (DMT)-like permease
MSKAAKGIVFAGITAILWGVLAIALKVSLKDVSPVGITWFRFMLAFLGLAVYYFVKKPGYLRILKKPPLILILASFCLGINYIGFIEGVHQTSPSIAQIFIQMGPVLLALSGFIFFREKLVLRQIVGFIFVAAGLILFYREQGSMITGNVNALRMGTLWVLTAAFTWAIYAVLLKVLVQRYPPMQLNLVIFGLPALLYLPFVEFSGFLHLTFTDWMIMIFLGLNTLVAYGTLSMAIQNIEANKVSVILILNPIITVALMGMLSSMDVTWIAHEHYTFFGILGAGIVLSGAILTILRPFKKTDRKG